MQQFPLSHEVGLGVEDQVLLDPHNLHMALQPLHLLCVLCRADPFVHLLAQFLCQPQCLSQVLFVRVELVSVVQNLIGGGEGREGRGEGRGGERRGEGKGDRRGRGVGRGVGRERGWERGWERGQQRSGEGRGGERNGEGTGEGTGEEWGGKGRGEEGRGEGEGTGEGRGEDRTLLVYPITDDDSCMQVACCTLAFPFTLQFFD